MSDSNLPEPRPSERVGALPRAEAKGAEPDFAALLVSWLDSHRGSLVDGLRRLGRQPLGSFLTCLAMAVALSLPMGLSLLLDDIARLGGSWQRAAQISLFTTLDVDDAAGERLRARIAALPEVAEAEWIGRERGLEEFQRQSGLGEALRGLPENPLPGVILVTPRAIDKTGLEALRLQLEDFSGVQLVQLDLLWVERLGAILALGERFVFGLSVLLVLALLLVIGNTIRLHIENRRSEIEVIKLVGGTDGYVRRPFLYMGTLYGCGAGLLAWLVLVYGIDWLNAAVVRLAGLYGSDFALAGIPLEDGLSLLLGAVLLGYVGAWLAVARHLSELAPR
ncbi:permease-like cell division protein FtsX [Azotobacter beijerinckii]|uniref:Cell division protein FtsX n=1 Tax=Azotobacter beijerinckii TaxID=170623 RepID=A0A1I4DLE9_9GAMM|nr:permease-like cell division protein FtsX [Azotobacter beijerinckii]SFB38459.1 cell division protein FtsX [Azotobacter beijerinckii]SFK94402.1 cell division protein FtsX [Azotobacter beijerinckii]